MPDDELLARLAGGELRELLSLLDGSSVEELELELAGTRLFVKRRPSAEPPASDSHVSAAAAGSEAAFVVAERVGFFHFPADRGQIPTVNDAVTAGQVLGVIDSLNVPIPVLAPSAGRLEEVLVEEGQPVEYGHPLFVILPERQADD